MISRAKLEQLASILEGVPIWGCLQGSASARAGMQYGDILLRVNGQRVRSIEEYLQARKLDERAMEVRLVRGGSEQDLRLALSNREPLDEAELQKLGEEIVASRMISPSEPPGPAEPES